MFDQYARYGRPIHPLAAHDRAGSLARGGDEQAALSLSQQVALCICRPSTSRSRRSPTSSPPSPAVRSPPVRLRDRPRAPDSTRGPHVAAPGPLCLPRGYTPPPPHTHTHPTPHTPPQCDRLAAILQTSASFQNFLCQYIFLCLPFTRIPLCLCAFLCIFLCLPFTRAPPRPARPPFGTASPRCWRHAAGGRCWDGVSSEVGRQSRLLGRCVGRSGLVGVGGALVTRGAGRGRQAHVPYRNSKLTQLLQVRRVGRRRGGRGGREGGGEGGREGKREEGRDRHLRPGGE